MFSNSFADFVKKHQHGKVAIGMHRNADLDALCSAYALSAIFPNSVILTPDEMNRPAKNFAKDMGISVKEFKSVKKEQFDGLIVVDCGTYALISEAKGWKILCHIDHHKKGEGEEVITSELQLWDPDSPSTCEIIAKNIPKITKEAAFALSIGIVSDTARFKNGRAETFAELAKLIPICGKSYSEILKYAEPEREADEKVAILKAFREASVLTYKNFVIATTIVSKNESDSSSSLSEFADIAFSASWKSREKETRLSSRARKHVPIAMNKIMAGIGEKFSASGGGHAKAAGANAKERPEKVLEACVEAVKDALDSIQ